MKHHLVRWKELAVAVRCMRQELLIRGVWIPLNDITPGIPLTIHDTIGTGSIEADTIPIKTLSKVCLRRVQLVPHATRIFTRVINSMTIDVVVKIRSDLSKVLRRVVVRIRIGHARISVDSIVEVLTVREGESITVVAVHGLVAEPGLCRSATAEDGVTV